MSRGLLHLTALTEKELRAATSITLAHYDQDADSYWQGTRDHDVSQNVEALLRHLHGKRPYTILDFGCGPGRDLVRFRELGHEAVGLDGAEQFVQMARDHSGCEILHQDFLALDLSSQRFDGVYANASLFHVPTQELLRVLKQLSSCLKTSGVLFSSNPHGSNWEGWSGNRYCCFLQHAEWRWFMAAAGFIELEYYYRPTGRPRQRQPWLASIWRKRQA